MLRCFHELKIPVTPIIIRHIHYPCSIEFCNAIGVCNELHITPTIINIDLVDICSNGESDRIIDKYQTDHIAFVELMHVLELVSEPSILADDITMYRRSIGKSLLNIRETDNREWYYTLFESYDVHWKFEHLSGIPTIGDTYKYTPECWAALITPTIVQDMVFNERFKTSAMSTKNLMMSKEFNVPFREKTEVFSTGIYARLQLKIEYTATMKFGDLQSVNIGYLTLLDQLGHRDAI